MTNVNHMMPIGLMSDANQIMPRLWLGNFWSSQDQDLITKHQITVIINCTKDLPFMDLPGVYKYRVPVDDNLQKKEIIDMIYWLVKILPIIDHHLQYGRSILIHCAAGVQRSAIVVLSYLYFYHSHNAILSYTLIKSHRPVAFSPAINFKHSFCLLFGQQACHELNVAIK